MPLLMVYKQGDIVLVPFPFSDSSVQKKRPVVIYSNDLFNEQHPVFMALMITTAKKGHWPTDVSIKDQTVAGLPKPSFIRFKLFSIDTQLIEKKLGRLSERDLSQAKQALGAVF